MIYVGIDVAKLNHFASAISSDGEVLFEPFQFLNDTDGFRLLASHLDSLPGDSIIGPHSTAHYSDNLVRFLVSSGYKVCLINPIQTSVMRRNNIRKTKTDSVDTFPAGGWGSPKPPLSLPVINVLLSESTYYDILRSV